MGPLATVAGLSMLLSLVAPQLELSPRFWPVMGSSSEERRGSSLEIQSASRTWTRISVLSSLVPQVNATVPLVGDQRDIGHNVTVEKRTLYES